VSASKECSSRRDTRASGTRVQVHVAAGVWGPNRAQKKGASAMERIAPVGKVRHTRGLVSE
jgi:hypothetical protein